MLTPRTADEPFVLAICILYSGARAAAIIDASKTGENNAFYNAMSKDMVALGLPMGRQKHFSRSIAHPGALEIWWRTMEDSVRHSASPASRLC